MPGINLTVPLIAAAVFTLGGYGIWRSERHAEAVGGVLGLAFAICAVLAVLALLAQVAERNGVRDTGHVYAAQATGRMGAYPAK